MNIDKLCIYCFSKFNEFNRCTKCGKEHTDVTTQQNISHLPLKYFLFGRYIIGQAIGTGGFGVTYKAWDTKLNVAVAIKEYYPNGLVNRVPGTATVLIYSGDKISQYNNGLDMFLEEARNMARFNSNPNIVNIIDFFEDNNTAYIVMEYLSGITLKEYLKDNNGKLEVSEVQKISIPIIDALHAMHDQKILHRDVSPDNIIITDSNCVKLIDFGAARYSFSGQDKKMSIIIKPGYAPPEQYRTNGRQGVYTDVYAVGATIYQMLTGCIPVESIDRLSQDKLDRPSKLNNSIPEYIDKCVMKAISINKNIRFNSMQVFKKAFTNIKDIDYPEIEIVKRKKTRLIASIIACIIALISAGIIYINRDFTLHGDTLVAWYPVSQNENTVAIQNNAYNSISNDFVQAMDDIGIDNVNIVNIPIPENEYVNTLKEAIKDSSLPDIFVSNYLEPDELNITANVSRVFDNIDINEYLLLSQYTKSNKKLSYVPLAFTTSVLYKNKGIIQEAEVNFNSNRLTYYDIENSLRTFSNSCYYGFAIDSNSYDEYILSRCDSNMLLNSHKKIFSSTQSIDLLDNIRSSYIEQGISVDNNIIDLFYDDEIAMLISSVSLLKDVRINLPGYYELGPIPGKSNIPITFTNCWSINDKVSQNKKYLAEKYLSSLLSENSQNLLMLQTCDAIPLNNNTFDKFISVNNDLSFLQSEVNNLTTYNYSQDIISKYNEQILAKILALDDYTKETLINYINGE